MMKKARWLAGFFLVIVFLLMVACSGPTSEASATDAYTVAMEPIGHWHVLNPKTLQFTVRDSAMSEGVAGLDLVVELARVGSDRITERSVSADQVKDEGNGVYSLEYTPSSIGAYSLIARAVHNGQQYVSAPVAFEVAKGGEEGIKVDAGGETYVYQVRYYWEPGHIHANDDEPVKLVFELMRGAQVGDEINWDQPWTNTFDHVTSAENATALLESEDGTVSEELQFVYKGRGIYEAERIFTEAEVGDGKEYTVRCSFIDPANGGLVTHSEPFPLHAVASH